MTDKVVILVTAVNLNECKKIARHLVETRLAACVSIASPVHSIYHWEGKVEESEECLMLIKSSRRLFEEIKAAIANLHSYTTPEIICLPIIDGSRNYLQWMEGSVKPVEGEQAVDV